MSKNLVLAATATFAGFYFFTKAGIRIANSMIKRNDVVEDKHGCYVPLLERPSVQNAASETCTLAMGSFGVGLLMYADDLFRK